MARTVITRTHIRKASKEFEVRGLDEMYGNLERIVEATGQSAGIELKRVFMKAAVTGLVERAKQLAPFRAKRGRTKITTHLRDAIFADYGPDGKPNVLVGVNGRRAPHGRWIEYGTPRMIARPFWRPAISGTRDFMAKVIVQGFLKLIHSKIK